MKLSQITYYAHDDEQVDQIKDQFGLGSDWVEDLFTADVEVYRFGGTQLGELSGRSLVNFDLGMELEIITYFDGPHWMTDRAGFQTRLPFLSSIGFENGGVEMARPKEFHLVQSMVTTSHTANHIADNGSFFNHEIYRNSTGCLPDQKYTWRIDR